MSLCQKKTCGSIKQKDRPMFRNYCLVWYFPKIV